MPSLVATTSALTQKQCVRTPHVRTNLSIGSEEKEWTKNRWSLIKILAAKTDEVCMGEGKGVWLCKIKSLTFWGNEDQDDEDQEKK